MKSLSILLFLIFSTLGSNAQYYRNYEKRPHVVGNRFNNSIIEDNYTIKKRVNILPILGAIITTAIISTQINEYDYYDLSYSERSRQRFYQNQLELQRLDILERQFKILEMQNHRKENRFFGIFRKKHHTY